VCELFLAKAETLLIPKLITATPKVRENQYIDPVLITNPRI